MASFSDWLKDRPRTDAPVISCSHWGMFPHTLISLLMIEAMKPPGPAMDHEPTAKFFRGEYLP